MVILRNSDWSVGRTGHFRGLCDDGRFITSGKFFKTGNFECDLNDGLQNFLGVAGNITGRGLVAITI